MSKLARWNAVGALAVVAAAAGRMMWGSPGAMPPEVLAPVEMPTHTQAIKTLWQEDEPAWQGKFEHFDTAWSFPKPVQKPNPPILIGGESIHTLRRVVAFGDGWFPRARGGFDAANEADRLRRVADAGERDMATLSISVFGAPPKAETLDSYRAAGIDRAVLALPSAGADQILPLLDRYAGLL